MKINFGSGLAYKEGWCNIDINKNLKADVLIKPNQIKLPIKSNSVGYILADSVLEHIEQKQVIKYLCEFHRILKKGGILEIYVPHYTSISTKYIGHFKCYGIDSFVEFDVKNKSKLDEHYPRYKIIKQELFLVSRHWNATFYKKIVFLNKLNFIFNWDIILQQFFEKYLPGGFEEVHFVMQKVGGLRR